MPIPRTFSNLINPGHSTPNFQYLWDPTLITTGGNSVITGGFRAFTTADISNTSLNVSGLNLSVGAVTLTGTNPVTVQNASLAVVGVGGYFGITGVPTVTVLNPLAITGTTNVNVTNSAPINVTGIILTQVTGAIGGTVQVNSVSITGNPGFVLTGAATGIGFISIDTGVRAVNITSQSIPLNVTGNFSLTGNLTVGSVQVTGFNSGSALGSLDLTHTYLITSGIGTSATASTSSVALTGFNPNLPPLPISGVIGVTIGSVAVTGGSINSITIDPISWGLLSGISGALTTNLTAAAFVTGQVSIIGGVSGSALGSLDLSHTYIITSGIVLPTTSFSLTGFSPNLPPLPFSGNVNITNTAPINVTGIVLTQVTGNISTSVTNPIGVTGTSLDINSGYTGANMKLWPYLNVGGRVVNVSGGGLLTTYNTGDNIVFNFANNGAVLSNPGALDRTFDEVTMWAVGTGVVSNEAVSGNFGTVLGTNPNRRMWFIQNLHTGALMVRFSTTMPSPTGINMILKGASVGTGSDGASYSDDAGRWRGPVSVSGFGGAPVLYNVWEL